MRSCSNASEFWRHGTLVDLTDTWSSLSTDGGNAKWQRYTRHFLLYVVAVSLPPPLGPAYPRRLNRIHLCRGWGDVFHHSVSSQGYVFVGAHSHPSQARIANRDRRCRRLTGTRTHATEKAIGCRAYACSPKSRGHGLIRHISVTYPCPPFPGDPNAKYPQMLVHLAVDEPGENWTSSSFRWSM